MSEIIDLDVIVPETAKVKFNGNEIEVNPPRTVDLLVIGSMMESLSSEAIEGLSDQEIQNRLDKLENRIYVCIPELKGTKLNKVQLESLVSLLSRMTRPRSSEELEKRGIAPDSPKAE